jgi:histone-lysine N-methyltransferase SETMAR
MLKPKSSQTEDVHTFTKQTVTFKQTLSARQKSDGNRFLGQERVLVVEFMQQGTTVISEVYRETVKKLLMAIQKNRRGMLASGVMLLHDNAPPRTDPCTRALLEHCNWELFDHPPYSPDLALSDYNLFTYLK